VLLLIRVCISLLPLHIGILVRVALLLRVKTALLARLLGRALLKLRNMFAIIGVRSCTILSRKGGLSVEHRVIVVLILSLALMPLILLIGLTIMWILSLDVGVLNRNLLNRIALVAYLLSCSILSRKGGLSVVNRLRVVLILALALLPLVLLIGLTILWILSLDVGVLNWNLLNRIALVACLLSCSI
jgi:hypothetical protein